MTAATYSMTLGIFHDVPGQLIRSNLLKVQHHISSEGEQSETCDRRPCLLTCESLLLVISDDRVVGTVHSREPFSHVKSVQHVTRHARNWCLCLGAAQDS